MHCSLRSSPLINNMFTTTSSSTTKLSLLNSQVNFFQDHTKVILSPCMAAITYINEKRNARTFSFKSIEKYGCCRELEKRMNYALDRVEDLRTTLRNNHQHAGAHRDVVKSRPERLQAISNKPQKNF